MDTAPPVTRGQVTEGTVTVRADDGAGGSGVHRTVVTFDGADTVVYELLSTGAPDGRRSPKDVRPCLPGGLGERLGARNEAGGPP